MLVDLELCYGWMKKSGSFNMTVVWNDNIRLWHSVERE